MRHFLLDTNHLGDAIKPVSVIREKVERAARRGIRIGTIVPVLCELEAGSRPSARYEERRSDLLILLRTVRIWPLEEEVAVNLCELFVAAKSKGKALASVDLMLAALARMKKLTILTADKDFAVFPDLRVENWLK